MKNHMKIFWFITFHTKLKIDGFISAYYAARFLVLFGAEKYDSIYKRIIYLIRIESGITYVFSHNYRRIKFNLYDSWFLETILTFPNAIILIKSVFNKDR